MVQNIYVYHMLKIVYHNFAEHSAVQHQLFLKIQYGMFQNYANHRSNVQLITYTVSSETEQH